MAKKAHRDTDSENLDVSEKVNAKQRKSDYRPDGSSVNQEIDLYGGSQLMNGQSHYNAGSHLHYSPKEEVTILGSALSKPEGQMTALEKMDLVRSGVTKKELERLKEKTGLDYDALAQALSVTRATLINKKNDEKFNAPLSERIVGLADIYSYGYEVFEDTRLFNQWMFRPNQALGGQPPYQLIDNQFGREEVRNIIGRIDYGVYS